MLSKSQGRSTTGLCYRTPRSRPPRQQSLLPSCTGGRQNSGDTQKSIHSVRTPHTSLNLNSFWRTVIRYTIERIANNFFFFLEKSCCWIFSVGLILRCHLNSDDPWCWQWLLIAEYSKPPLLRFSPYSKKYSLQGPLRSSCACRSDRIVYLSRLGCVHAWLHWIRIRH
jgi:hypothetical protein